LVEQGIIEYAHWIWHNAEEDEKKPHAHVVLQPNKRLNTGALQNEFKELVAGSPPLGVLPFKTSKMIDWVLYAVHDTAYLIRKGKQKRKYTYNRDEIRSTDSDQLEEDWKDAHEGEDTRIKQIIELAQQGVSWPDVVKLGLIPINQLFQFKDVHMMFFNCPSETMRNEREGHEDKAY
jgi:hypothetical protein